MKPQILVALIAGLTATTALQAGQAPSVGKGCAREDTRARAAGWDMNFGQHIYRACEPQVTAPERLNAVKPMYTPQAMSAKIQGMVVLGAVINADGSVGEVRVLQSLDRVFGLDANAIDAVKRSTFTAGTVGGKAVPVLVIIDQQFTLR